MGKRGPPKQPSAIQKSRGNPSRRPLLRDEPQPQGEAICPDSLSEGARKVWARLAPQLKGMGVLTQIDTDTLGRYCEVWVQWRKATDEIVEKGTTVDDRQRAVVKVVREAGAEMTRLEMVFGMNPSSRASLSVTPNRDKEEPSIADFVNQKPKLVKGSAG